MKKQLLKWHNALMWFGLIAIICWAISGISHPLMAWFGPQSSHMFPPHLNTNGENVLAIKSIINQHKIHQAAIVKLTPTADGPMLQVTQTENNNLSRRYFSLDDGNEINDYDQQQARWLAEYYTGIDVSKVKSVHLIKSFNHDYPRVNRLLPVYQVTIGDDTDPISAYVYTETNALAALNNSNKKVLQSVFHALHTWSWLDVTGQGRVILMALLLLSLLAMAVTGLLLVINLSQRKIKHTSRRWHRIAGYVLWLPLMAWSASGFYHLLHAHYVEPVSGVRLGKTVDLQQWQHNTTNNSQWLNNFQQHPAQGKPLNAISLVHGNNSSYYRLSVAPEQKTNVTRNARFDGQASELGVVYINSLTGLYSPYSDQDQVLVLFKQLLGDTIKYNDIEKITHFGKGYDFRNKRLPVWKIEVVDKAKTHIFVDPITGILVDQNRAVDRLESLSFSLLHKWNHLAPFIGRQWRDVVIVLTLISCLLTSLLGLKIYLGRGKKIKSN